MRFTWIVGLAGAVVLAALFASLGRAQQKTGLSRTANSAAGDWPRCLEPSRRRILLIQVGQQSFDPSAKVGVGQTVKLSLRD